MLLFIGGPIMDKINKEDTDTKKDSNNNYNMTHHTLLMETSVLIPTNDISRHVNDIAETIPDTEFDEFRHYRSLI